MIPIGPFRFAPSYARILVNLSFLLDGYMMRFIRLKLFATYDQPQINPSHPLLLP